MAQTVKNGFLRVKNNRLPHDKMARTRNNFFAALDLDNEVQRGGTATRGGQTAARNRPVQTRPRIPMALFDIDATRSWGDIALEIDTGKRLITQAPARQVSFSAVERYTDMCDEPWKYGDDILEVEELHEKVKGEPQVTAFWERKDRELEQKERERVIRAAGMLIQKVVRGHMVRINNPHLDCCMCLSHRISPFKTSVGFMCPDCARMGPYEDVVEDDPWNWHRADAVRVTA